MIMRPIIVVFIILMWLEIREINDKLSNLSHKKTQEIAYENTSD